MLVWHCVVQCMGKGFGQYGAGGSAEIKSNGNKVAQRILSGMEGQWENYDPSKQNVDYNNAGCVYHHLCGALFHLIIPSKNSSLP